MTHFILTYSARFNKNPNWSEASQMNTSNNNKHKINLFKPEEKSSKHFDCSDLNSALGGGSKGSND